MNYFKFLSFSVMLCITTIVFADRDSYNVNGSNQVTNNDTTNNINDQRRTTNVDINASRKIDTTIGEINIGSKKSTNNTSQNNNGGTGNTNTMNNFNTPQTDGNQK